MSELGRVLRVEARRTAPLIAVPLLTAVGVVTAWLSLVPDVAYWDNTVVALVNSVRVLGPLAAGLAAWASVRERRLDYLRDLTPRSPATGSLVDMALLSAAALAAYGTVAAVVAVDTALREQAGQAQVMGILAGATALVMHVAAGYLAGRLVPRLATSAVVVVATWLWATARTPGTSWWSLLPPAALNEVELFTGLRSQVLADGVLWSAGLTTALILAYVWRLNRRLWMIVPLLAALSLTALATVRLEASDGRAVGPAPTGPSCREWPLTICVHPALRGALPSLMTATTPLAARLNGTPGAFTKIEQRPGTAPAGLSKGVAAIHLDGLAPGYEAQVVRQIRDGLVDTRACASQRRRAAEYRAMVDAWLLGTEQPHISDLRAARVFGTWTEQQRRAWLRANFGAYHRCALTARAFR
ncbi:hypothetical protein [Actinomadura rudentiformis]|uniref:Uncharacterized protein n=1 Tax=Actinomadura rudentiformis TaxID=359158 RepID=A0A6H9YW67_9ACTN|nr:hypothetical protein [Actinomadura rudentiformis]KAB2345989.1 hypothetical protein F8566_25035 [Actinomadura rudentiformis]